MESFWQQVEELFHAALQQPPDARAQFLASRCADNQALSDEVVSLLQAHETDEERPFTTFISEVAGRMLTAEADETLAGRQVRQYQILRLLGRGGMGEVYLAYDEKLRRQVALKRLRVNAALQPDAQARFIREAQAAAQLDHPNVCTIYEVLEDDGECFIVMQYVAGVTLAERLQQRRLAVPETLAIATQIADALATAHRTGVIHRDIKPQNIMLNQQGVVKVLDFGIARLATERAGAAEAAHSTTGGLILGRPNYMSPEQARGQAVDACSDLFSLGVLLYEMLSGQAPFDAPSASEVIANLLKSEPPPLSQTLPDAPAELQQLIGKALAKEPTARYQSADELLNDLQRLQQATAFVVPPSGGKLAKPAAPIGRCNKNWQARAAQSV